jgi:hypothetical protein
MMRNWAFTLLLALAAAPALQAQQGVREERRLPPADARRAVEFYNHAQTIRFSGASRIPAGSVIHGNVAALDGDLTIAGRVEGEVVVINGGVVLLQGASVTGGITALGGTITGDAGGVAGERVSFADRLDYLRRGERIYADVGGEEAPPPAADRVAVAPPPADSVHDAQGGWTAADSTAEAARAPEPDAEEDLGGWSLDRATHHQGRADFIVATGQSYNRVEGLPITFGPLLETSGSNPLRLRAMGILRTESGPELGPERWGFDLRAEQFLGGRRQLRVGVSAFRRIDPIEDWHLNKLENGLATFFLHRDFRDHFDRQGLSAFITATPRHSPLQATLEYRSERDRSQPAGSPFALFNNNEPWRPQPLVAHGSLQSLEARVRLDTRSNADDPTSGWLALAQLEQGLRSTLRQPDYLTLYDPTSSLPVPVIAGTPYGTFTAGTLELRRYNRVGPWSRLNLRALLAGSLDGSPLPPQRQHALGGAGSLPGFALFSQDCGARARRIFRFSDVAGHDPASTQPLRSYFPRYGCDRVALLQAEYRGDLRLHLGNEGDDTLDAEEEDGGWVRTALRNGMRAGFGWVLFADAGQGWSRDADYPGSDTAADVGAGIVIGHLGIYGAVPVTHGGQGFNLFIRLSPRI